MVIHNHYVRSLPCKQNALDIFKDGWSSNIIGRHGESELSDELQRLKSGNSLLFDDPRMAWIIEELGGVEGLKILELGPLEAGHTFMLQRAGASVLSLEASVHAYLKCLIAKEILNFTNTHFLCGDFMEFLRQNQIRFDLCVACRVLYHMVNPVELIGLCSRASNRIFVWSHYYDKEIIQEHYKQYRFSEDGKVTFEGFSCPAYLQGYGNESRLENPNFIGGSESYSHWIRRDDMLACLKHFGFTDIRIHPQHDTPHHPNGPCLAIMAFKETV